MHLIRRNHRLSILTILALILTLSAVSRGKDNEHFPTVKIKNFGQMTEQFYRGAQPKQGDYGSLAALGIRTVIDLQDDPKSYEKAAVEGAGMRYVNIPMDDKSYPKSEQIEAFLKLVDNPETGKFYVHCAGGRHRTGVMGAVYRFTHDHWNYDQVYAEMKQYDFYSRWGHGPMKQFVQDYWQQHQQQAGAPATAATAAR
ncbi:MAG: fused DSP-PTPase phosphatase/NAD kinase-like protein [Pyrinomonadaceae bacterium]